MSLFLIIEESASVVRDELSAKAKELNYSSSQIIELTEWNFVSKYLSPSLFGDTYLFFLNLANKDDIKAFAKKIEANPTLFTNNWYGSDLFIAVSTAQGAKKIEELVVKCKGKVQKKLKPEAVRDAMLCKIHIAADIKDALRDFVGDDYEMLVSFVNDCSKLPRAQQEAMQAEQVFIALPQKPGSIKPWEFISPMLKGDINQLMQLYERTAVNTHILVLMLFARQRLELIYRVRLAQEEGLWKSSDIAKSIGVKDGPSLWEVTKTAKALSVDTCEWLAKYTINTENSIKGGKNIDAKAQFKIFLASVALSIKFNRCLSA